MGNYLKKKRMDRKIQLFQSCHMKGLLTCQSLLQQQMKFHKGIHDIFMKYIVYANVHPLSVATFCSSSEILPRLVEPRVSVWDDVTF